MNRAALAVGLVLLLGLASMPTLPAQNVSTPLVVDSVTVQDGRPMFVDEEPNKQTVTVNVRNDGARASTAYELRYLWEDADGARTYLRGSLESSTASGRPLLPGQSAPPHSIEWTPSESQLGPGHLVVSVHEGGAHHEHEPIPLLVENHGLEVELESRLPLEIGADETLHIPISVHATGNVPEHVTWSVDHAPSRLTATFAEPEQTVPHDDPEGATAVLVVSYPFEGSTEDALDLTVRVRATTPEGLVRTVTSPEIDILHGDGPPPPSLSLDGPSTTVFAAAGETVQVPFTLTNTGGQPDRYTFVREATNGWEAEPATANGQTVHEVSLAPGASRDLLVAVTPGPDAQRLATLRLTATSQAGVPDTATVDLAIAGALPVITSVGFTQDPLYRGDPALLRVGYQNAGNAAMEDATLTVHVAYAEGGTVTKTVALPDLPGGDRSRAVTLDLGTARGPGPARLSAELTAGSDGDTVDGIQRFVHSGLLSVTAPEPVVGHPGEQVRYHTPPHAFQVRNDGNARETFNVHADGATLLGGASFELDPGQTRTVAVTQTVPADVGDARTVPVTLTASLDAAPDRSDADTVATPVQDDAPPTLTWVEAPETMPPADARPVRVRADDDTYVHAAWLIVAPLDPDAPDGSAFRVDLTESGDWIGLLRSGLPGAYEMTPHAQDAFGNVGTGETRGLEVASTPAAAAPEPVTIDEVRYSNGTLTVRTNAAAVRVLVGGDQTVHDVPDGELVLDLPLDAGSHLVQVFADRADGTTVAANTTADVAAPPAEPGILARLTPGPGPLLAAAAVVVAALARRRNRGGPHD